LDDELHAAFMAWASAEELIADLQVGVLARSSVLKGSRRWSHSRGSRW
jgi:hypothetical protein